MPFDGIDGYGLALRAAARGVRPRELLSTSDWAAKYRILTGKSAAEPGRWNPDRIPFLRGIMDALDEGHPAPLVVFIKSSQVGGSECGLNWIGRTIHIAPASMLALFPTEKSARKWVRTRLNGMLAASPDLRTLIPTGRKNENSNTLQEKHFPGGVLFTGSANIPEDVASVSVARLLLDEVDRMPLTIEDEGDPIELAKRRVATFFRRKIFEISTPTVEETSRIWADWLLSTQDRFFVPCPSCGAFQVLSFENLKWPEGKPEQAVLLCEECARSIQERQKTEMLIEGEWRATFPEREHEAKGFHVNGLYTPIGLGDTWAQHAHAWEQARGKPAKVQAFFNTRRGEVVKGEKLQLEWEAVKQRAEPYRLRTVPVGALILTASGDVQKDRVEVKILGHGRDEAIWVIDVSVLEGDPTRPEVWKLVDDYFAAEILNEAGIPMRIACALVDSGAWQHEVINFTRERKNRNIFASKGSSIVSKQPIGRPSHVDVKYNGQTYKRGAEQYQIGVSALKTTLYGRLLADDRATISERHVHFSTDLPAEYFRQLTAERFDPREGWVKRYDHNEQLDLFVLGMAAAMHHSVQVHRLRELDWQRLEMLYAHRPKVAAKDAPVLGKDAIDNSRGFFPTAAKTKRD